MAVKQVVEEKQARTRLKRKSMSYITDLEDIRKEAKNKGNLQLAADITLRLLDHGIGKPTEHKQIEFDLPAQVEIVIMLAPGSRFRELLPGGVIDSKAISSEVVEG